MDSETTRHARAATISIDFIERGTERMLWRTTLASAPAVGDAVVFPSERAVVVIERIWRMKSDDRENYLQLVVDDPDDNGSSST